MPIHYATIINIVGINLPQQHNPMATPRNAILALLSFILPLLLQLIELKFQNESNSVFEAHPKPPRWLELLYYYLPCQLELTSPSTLLLLLLLLLVSLASLLFPDEWRPLIYVIYVLLSLGNYLCGLVRKWCGWIQKGMMDKLQTSFTGMRPWHIMIRGPAILHLTIINMQDTRYRVRIDTSPSTASTCLVIS